MIPDPIDLGDDLADAVDAMFAAANVWLQPLATVIAGLLAVLAAAIAYRAVKRQIDANAENVQKQIDAAAAEQQKNQGAEWARMRRTEVLDLLLEAGNMARAFASAATNYQMIVENPSGDQEDDARLKAEKAAEYAGIDVRIVADKLAMHGLNAVSLPLQLLRHEAGDVISETGEGPWTIYEGEQAVFDAIKDALRRPPV